MSTNRGGARVGPAGPPGPRLFEFDRSLGTRFVAGADEAGRGCLAGPLVAAGVLFDQSRLTSAQIESLSALNDSKRSSPELRARMYPLILRIATRVVVVSRCAAGIDRRGLHRTNIAALRDALAALERADCMCLSDGFAVQVGESSPGTSGGSSAGQAGADDSPGPCAGATYRALVKGDATSAAIAAASVIAKETRDRYMRAIDATYPGWGFNEHVGYATATHREAIARLGVTPLHRLSFQSTAYQQLTLG